MSANVNEKRRRVLLPKHIPMKDIDTFARQHGCKLRQCLDGSLAMVPEEKSEPKIIPVLRTLANGSRINSAVHTLGRIQPEGAA